MKAFNRQFNVASVCLIVFLLTLTGCASKSASNASPKPSPTTSQAASPAATLAATPTAGPAATVTVHVIEGVQQLPIEIMMTKGIAEKYNLKIDKRAMSDPQAVYTAMKTPQFQVAFGSWPTIALMRSQGIKATNVFSLMTFTNDVIVKKDSPLKSIADLKGKRVASFGGASAGTTVIFRMLAQEYYGINLLKDTKFQFGAAPLLTGMLDRGDLDAVLLAQPLITQLLDSGNYRSIGDIGKIWKEKKGEDTINVCVVFNEDWAKANPDVAKRFVAAYKESIEYLKTQKDIWPELAAKLQIKTATGAETFHQIMSGIMINQWNQKLIDDQYKSFDLMKKLFPDLEGIPAKIPDGTFSLDYVS